MSLNILDAPPPPYDVRISYGEHELQFGDLRLPSGSGKPPLLVVVHGGFWRSRYSLEYMGHVSAALTAAGYATWNIEYRRIGNAGGGWSGTFNDVALATDFVRQLAPQYNLDTGKVATLGHSAGGHLALWLAARSRARHPDLVHSTPAFKLYGAISFAGVCDLRMAWNYQLSGGVVEQLLNGSPDAAPERYAAVSPAELLPLGTRQLLVHGMDDAPVPFAISQSYYEKAKAAGDNVLLLALPDTGHFEIVDPESSVWQQIMLEIDTFMQ